MHLTNKPALRPSARVRGIPQALSVYINQLVYDLRRRNHDIIALSLGEAFFEIPRFSFEPLDFERGYHYSDSQGWPALRDKIASYYNTRYGSQADGATNVLVSAGSKPIIFMLMHAVLDIGSTVVIHEPAWLSYQEQARLCGAIVKFVPFDLPIDRFHEYLDDDVRLVVINNPNNPVGRVYTAEELTSLYEQCRSRGIYLLVDEAYSDFVAGPEFHSIAELIPDLDGAIAVNSLSKNMGMSGWRVGYAIAEKELIADLLTLNQHIITCAPTILLIYLTAYFDEILSYTLPQVKAVVEKRARVALRMDEIGIKYLPGASTFYFFVDVGEYVGDVHELSLYLLLDKGIATVPGSAYGVSTERFLRVSIGTESEERIEQALMVLKSVLATGIEEGFVERELTRLNLPRFRRVDA